MEALAGRTRIWTADNSARNGNFAALYNKIDAREVAKQSMVWKHGAGMSYLALDSAMISEPQITSGAFLSRAVSVDGAMQPPQQTSALFEHPHGLIVDDGVDIYSARWNSRQADPVN